MATVEERLKKASEKLEKLRTQKKKLEETIKKTESDVVKYQDILNRAKYDKLTDSLRLNGVTLDDVINALNNGNIQPLQVKVQPKDAADEEIGGISHG